MTDAEIEAVARRVRRARKIDADAPFRPAFMPQTSLAMPGWQWIANEVRGQVEILDAIFAVRDEARRAA